MTDEKSTEYADELEIMALALDMQTQICIYQATPQMQLIAKLPLQSTWPQMNLCYLMDTVKQVGHFDLSVLPTQDRNQMWSQNRNITVPHLWSCCV